MTWTILQVALGGAFGATARYLSGVAALRIMGSGFPWGTMFVNVVGSFLMGLLVVALAHLGGNRFAPFLMIGCLGGFTTFSSFSLDAITLYERGAVTEAALYVLASVLVSLMALGLGLFLARSAIS